MFRISEHKGLSYRMLVFHQVVESGSFTAAAAELGHTKSGVSSYISQLERQLGIRLLNRSTRRLNLTPAGEQFARRCEELAQLLYLAVDEVSDYDNMPQGRIAITAPHSFESSMVTPLIAELCQQYPKLIPELIYTDKRLDILTHKLDLAISVGPQKDSNYHAIRLGEIDAILVAAPIYLARNEVESLDDLVSASCIMLPWQESTLLKGGKREGCFTSQRLIRLNSSPSAINSALAGLGVALIPSLFAKPMLDNGQLVRILPEYQGEKRDVYALHAYQQQLPLVLRQFVERLKNMMT